MTPRSTPDLHDLENLIRDFCYHRGTPQWEQARQMLGPYPALLLDALTRPGADLRESIRKFLPPNASAPPQSPRRPRLFTWLFPSWVSLRACEDAVAAVAAHAVLARFDTLLKLATRRTGYAYEWFACDAAPGDLPLEAGPATFADLLGALVETLARPDFQEEIVALVAAEAAARLGLAKGDPRLEHLSRQHVGKFVVLALDGFRAQPRAAIAGHSRLGEEMPSGLVR